MKQVENKKLPNYFAYLSLATNKGLTVDELKKIRTARKNVKEKLDEYIEVRKAINTPMSKDQPEQTPEEKEEVLAKTKELDEGIVEIAGLNFLTEDKVLGCCPQTFNQNDVDYMIEVLAK